ncbi:MAG TPA: AAA family ATPase [Gaiellaceae bacterium]|nr:AAA family ATPase [Gaiellaceae bacterium]
MLTCPSCRRENPDDSRFCNACGAPLATPERDGGEERKTVTVVFVDLVGFTAQAERLDPEDVRSVLSPYHARVRAELEWHGGTVEKFIGDAVMAVFGAPVAHEDDPERAVRAALSIRDWAKQQKALQVRIAVNTGEALVSLGARAAEGEAMVAGDVVNTAARMQSAAPVNGILVGESTRRATEGAIRFREAEPVHGKGKSEPIAVWEASEAIGRFGVDLSERPRVPLVGREQELELLRSLLARVRSERAAQLVTLVGVPGIGKSRLVSELFREVDEESELIRWRQGRCIPYGESITYWALGEVVKAEAGILESDASEEASAKLGAAVAQLVLDEGDARWVEAELRALVGLADRRQAGAESAGAAWRRFLDAVAARGPTVLVFEDLHWADDGLLDFLDDLVDWLRDAPLLVVGTARPELLERRRSWGGGKANATTISLRPLDDDQTANLIGELLGSPVQAAEERQALLERAGGNPLFAEQYVRMLSERGTTGTLPESVQGVIAARLDALPRIEKDLLQEAAVHGKVFWLGGLTGEGASEEALRSLERKDFVRRERQSTVAGDVQYAFQHVLLRDVAYGQIPRRERGQKHRGAAAWIESLGRPEDHAELLAHHYKQALELARAAGAEDDPQLIRKASEALAAAGERAFSLSAFDAAAAFFADALELLPSEDPARPELLLRRGRAMMVVGGGTPELMTEAIEGFRANGDTEGMAAAASVASRLAWFSGDRAATDRYLAEALDAVAGQPASRARAEALAHQSGYLMLGGEFEESIRIGTEALPLVTALGMQDQLARLHIVMGTARCCLGDEGGLAEIEEGIAIADADANVDMVVTGHDNLSSELQIFSRLADARRVWEVGLELSQRYGLGRSLRSARAMAAAWAYLDGDWDEALALSDELIAAAEAGTANYTDPIMYALRAWIRFARGDDAGADVDSARAAELARASDLQAQAAGYPVGAAIAAAHGRPAEARELASAFLAAGPSLVPAFCTPFPTLAEVAWVFVDLERGDELAAVILDATPVESSWREAARAIVAGEARRAADTIAATGHRAAAAYTRYRSGEPSAEADEFHRAAGAVRFLSAPEAPAAIRPNPPLA